MLEQFSLAGNRTSEGYMVHTLEEGWSWALVVPDPRTFSSSQASCRLPSCRRPPGPVNPMTYLTGRQSKASRVPGMRIETPSHGVTLSLPSWVCVCVLCRCGWMVGRYRVYIEEGRWPVPSSDDGVESGGLDCSKRNVLLWLPGIKATLSSRSGTVNLPPDGSRQRKE